MPVICSSQKSSKDGPLRILLLLAPISGPEKKREKCEQSFPTTELFIWPPPQKRTTMQISLACCGPTWRMHNFFVCRAQEGQKVQSMEIKIQLELN